MLETDERAEIEVVLSDLGPDLEQDFVDHLEAWDCSSDELVGSRPPTEEAPTDTSWVLRICYRVEWDLDQEQAVHWVDFPGESDPATSTFARVPKRLHDLLPVAVIESQRRPLRLHPRANFRRLLDHLGSGTIADDFDALVQAVAAAGEDLAKSSGIRTLVEQVLTPVQGPLGIDASDDSLVQFVPEGGSLSGLLRSLQPALDLGRPGHLPLHRHGSTTTALVQVGEAIAALRESGAVLLVDDFGEDLDAISARHLAATFRTQADQAWVSTRRAACLDTFRPEEVIRLHASGLERMAAQIDAPTTRAERIAIRHLSLQLLPAASASTVAIVEGPHDRAALESLALRRLERSGRPLPAASGVAIVDAGVVDGSGGASAVVRLSRLASQLGFHCVAVIDGDRGADGQQALADAESAADCVVRLPDGFAIERMIVDGLDDEVIIKTVKELCAVFGVHVPADLDTLTDTALAKAVGKVLKSSGGLHAQFVELLPRDNAPPRLRTLLKTIVKAGENHLVGLQQL
jgi:hypothetical protein